MANAQTVYEAVLALRADSTQLRTDLARGRGMLQEGLGGLQSLAKTLIPVLSIGSLVAFGKGVIDLAGNLQDLEDQTGISAQLLSGMNSLFEETGTSAEAFAKGIFTAQRNLGQINSAADPAALSVKALGLNLDELRNAPTQRFLELIAAALAKIDNPVQRAALGSQLLGRQFKELAPALAQAAGRLEEFKAAGMNADDIRKLDEAGDAWTRVGNQMKIIVAGPLADLLTGMERFFNLSQESKLLNSLIAIEDEISRIDSMLATRKSLREKGLGFLTAPSTADAEALRQRQALLDRQAELDAQRNRMNPAAKVRSPFVPLPDTGAQSKAAAAAKKAAEELKRIMEDAAKATADAIDEAQKRAEAAGADMIEVFKALKKEGLTPAETAVADINTRFDELIAKAVNAGAVTGQSMQPFIEQLEFFRRQAHLLTRPPAAEDNADAERGQQIRDRTAATKELASALTDLNTREFQAQQLSLALGDSYDLTSEKLSIQRQRVEELTREFGALSPQVQEAVGEFKKLEDQLAMESVFSGLTSSISRGIQDTLTGINEGSQTLADGMQNMLRNALLSLQVAILESTILKPLENIANSFFKGFAEAFAEGSDDAAAKMAKDMGQSLGNALRQVFSGLGGGGGFNFGNMFSGIGSWIGGLFGFEKGGLVPSFAQGGMVPALALPSFASGGAVPILAHAGEVVLRKPSVQRMGLGNALRLNQTGEMPGAGGNTSVTVQVNGDITPRRPDMKKEDVVKIVVQSMKDKGAVYGGMVEYGPRK